MCRRTMVRIRYISASYIIASQASVRPHCRTACRKVRYPRTLKTSKRRRGSVKHVLGANNGTGSIYHLRVEEYNDQTRRAYPSLTFSLCHLAESRGPKGFAHAILDLLARNTRSVRASVATLAFAPLPNRSHRSIKTVMVTFKIAKQMQRLLPRVRCIC